MDKIEIHDLITELTLASQQYYNLHTPIMTDAEYDSKIEILEDIKNKNVYPELFTDGSNGAKLFTEVAPGVMKKDVEHNPPMLSLAKAKTEKELSHFLKKLSFNGSKLFQIQAKLDGLAMKAVYKNGKLSQLATRGTATHGDDVSYALQDKNFSVQGLPNILPTKENIEVRGELFLNNKQFENVNNARISSTGEKFKNARNAGAGLLKRTEKGLDYPVEFTFSTYTFVKNGEIVNNDNFEDLGFITTALLTKNLTGDLKTINLTIDEISSSIEKFGKIRETLNIPTDGVVIKPMEEAELYKKLGVGSHHPHSQIAWKYPAEKATTIIKNIFVSVGKTGRLTPRAQFEPVYLDSIVEYASLHNFNILSEMDIRVGSQVVVEKANDIIPQIVTVVSQPSSSKKFEIPTVCPECKTLLENDENEKIYPPKTLYCPNNNCPSRMAFTIKVAASRQYLDIDGLGETAIERLTDIGIIKTIADLYKLDFNTLATLTTIKDDKERKLGEKTAKRIMDSIENSKTLPPFRILASLSISGLGKTMSKKLLKIYTMEELRKVKTIDLEKIDGIASITAKNIVQGLQEKDSLINELISLGVVLDTPNNNPEKISTLQNDENTEKTKNLENTSFNISGSVPTGFKNRNELIEWIEQNGGVYHSAPKKTTDFVIGDKTSSSSKIKKAISYNLTIISPEEFIEKFIH